MNYTILYDSDNDNTKQIVITDKMLSLIKKRYDEIDFIDSKTGKVDTLPLENAFKCKQIIINF